MRRREFVQTAFSTLMVADAPDRLGCYAPEPSDNTRAAEAKPEDIAFTPGPISGQLARGLMMPDTPCPLPQSRRFTALRFTGRSRDYRQVIEADTWYPSWGADGALYSSFADGRVKASNGSWVTVACYWIPLELWVRKLGLWYLNGRLTRDVGKQSSTGNAVLTGDDPFELAVSPLGSSTCESSLYEGYYPCANLYYKGVWYYGRYFCHRWLNDHNVPITYELGGFGGFRISHDGGKSWQESPFDAQRPLFPETGRCSDEAPIRLGAPHFVDFGRELEHSPDGYAYLTGHGTEDPEGISNWSSGDAVFVARVRPSPQSINNREAWEFFGGHDAAGRPVWTNDFTRIAPVLSWPGHAGCVNVTYHAGLRKYLGFLCSGWQDGDSGSYDIWMVESDALTGPWANVAYLKGEAGQPYFVCAPSKFLGPGNKIALFYSANWRPDRPGVASWKSANGPRGAYSLCVAEYELVERA